MSIADKLKAPEAPEAATATASTPEPAVEPKASAKPRKPRKPRKPKNTITEADATAFAAMFSPEEIRAKLSSQHVAALGTSSFEKIVAGLVELGQASEKEAKGIESVRVYRDGRIKTSGARKQRAKRTLGARLGGDEGSAEPEGEGEVLQAALVALYSSEGGPKQAAIVAALAKTRQGVECSQATVSNWLRGAIPSARFHKRLRKVLEKAGFLETEASD